MLSVELSLELRTLEKELLLFVHYMVGKEPELTIGGMLDTQQKK